MNCLSETLHQFAFFCDRERCVVCSIIENVLCYFIVQRELYIIYITY